MDRPPPLKRNRSSSNSDEDFIDFMKESGSRPLPFIPSLSSILPEIHGNSLDSSSQYIQPISLQFPLDYKNLKKRKFTENLQISSIFSNHKNSLLTSVKNFLKTLDTDELIESLSILSTELSIAQEPVLLSIPVGKVLEGLIKCLHYDISEIVLLSMNCLLTLLEVAPNFSPVLISIGSLPVIVSKVKNFSYVDIAEKAIKIIEKISKIDPGTIFNDGVFQLVLETLDFYEYDTQKSIINIGINILNLYPNVKLETASMERIFLKLFSYLSTPLSDKILELSDVFFDKVPATPSYLQSISDQGYFIYLSKKLTSDNFNLSKIFSIYKNLVKLDSKFISQIFTEDLKYIIENITNDGDSSATAEVLQIIINIFENPNMNFFNFKDLIVWVADLVIDQASRLFYKVLEINEQHLVLSIIENLVKAIPDYALEKYVCDKKLFYFLAENLGRNDFASIKSCIYVVMELLNKISDKVAVLLLKEGVLARIKCFKLVGEVNKLEKPGLKHNTRQDFYSFQAFSYKKIEKSAEISKIHTENVRKLVKCVKEILKKCKKYEKVIEENFLSIKSISKALSSPKESESGFLDLLSLLQKENSISSFEFINESLGSLIWSYISTKTSSQHLILILIESFSITNFETLAKMTKESIQFMQNMFSNSVPSKKLLHNLQMEYVLDSASLNSYKHPVFISTPVINLTVCQNTLIENIQLSLLGVNSEQDLNFLIESYKFNAGVGIYEYFNDLVEEGQRKTHSKKNLQIKLFYMNKELETWMTVQDLYEIDSNLAQNPIKFVIEYQEQNNITSDFFDSPDHLLLNIIKSSERNGVSHTHKLYSYYSILKFLYLVNEHLLPLTTNVKFASDLFECPKFSSLIQVSKPEKWLKSLSLNCGFLFTLSSRLKYFHSFTCMSSKNSVQRISINRKFPLKCAIRAMSELQQGVLEIDFEDELGTGQGPTLEFFTIVSEEISNLKIWIHTPTGLFPSPKTADPSFMHFTGKFIGKAIIDKRLIELNLSPVFWKLVFGCPILPYDLFEVDPIVYNSLQNLKAIESKDDISDLEIYFTLPGYDIELIPYGSVTKVTKTNMQEFISLVHKHLLLNFSASNFFRDGLCSIISLSDLQIFKPSEMNSLVCGEGLENWSVELLLKAIIPAHGFNYTSSTYLNLLEVISKFTSNEQKMFLKFVTGSPRLPNGGLGSLNPKLTVVKKEDSSDNHLPSVMTCQNYLKIPDYSSIETLRYNIYYAIHECAQTFYLS